MKQDKKFVVVLIVIIALLSMGSLFLPFTINEPTQNGETIGIINTVESNGYFWKTPVVYLKTLNYKEDTYCIDPNNSKAPELMQKAKSFAETHTVVKVLYHSEFIVGKWRCGREANNGIVDDILPSSS